MNQTTAVSQRADEIYRTGPETLVAQSSAILAGPVSNYARNVESRSEGGADSIPLKWVVTGILENPQVLKGRAPSASIRFSRSEQSIIIPTDPSTAAWEAVYGELAADGQVVVFLGESPGSILKVIPSGDGEQNLISLVKDVVQIQTIGDKSQRLPQWLRNLESSASDEGRKAALRSFIADGGEWAQLRPILERALANSQLSREFRAFGFGIVASGVIEEKWAGTRDEVLQFLCHSFTVERDPRLAMQDVYSLGLIFRYSDDENFRSQRLGVRRALERCLEERPSLVASGGSSADQGLEEQYQALRTKYLRR